MASEPLKREETRRIHAPDPHFGGPRCGVAPTEAARLARRDEDVTCETCRGSLRLEHMEVGGHD